MGGGIQKDDLSNEVKILEQTVSIGDIGLGDQKTFNILAPVRDLTIKKIGVSVSSDITAADTNYMTVAVKNGSDTVASLATGPAASGQSFTAGTIEWLTLDADYLSMERATDELTVVVDKEGNGLAADGLTFHLVLEMA